MEINDIKQYMMNKHDGQKRSQGTPYYFHPLAVYELVKSMGYGLDYQITALFHDLLEDTPVTKDELKALKIPNTIIDNIVLLTKSSNRLSDDELTEYYRKIKENPIARCVKIADLIDNLDLSRNIFSGIKEKDIQRSRKYLTHLNFLLGE